MRQKHWFIVIVIFLFIFPSKIFAQDQGLRLLQGIKGICVTVDLSTSSDLRIDQIKQIKTDTELMLRLAGIRVLTPEESFSIPGGPSLYIYISTKMLDIGLVIFRIDVQLREFAYLARYSESNKIMVAAPIWERMSLGSVGQYKVPQIRDEIKTMIDMFINDYLSINPKK